MINILDLLFKNKWIMFIQISLTRTQLKKMIRVKFPWKDLLVCLINLNNFQIGGLPQWIYFISTS